MTLVTSELWIYTMVLVLSTITAIKFDEMDGFVFAGHASAGSPVVNATKNMTANDENRVRWGEKLHSVERVPYIALIHSDAPDVDLGICSGFFVDPRHVATAAHCVLIHPSHQPEYPIARYIRVRANAVMSNGDRHDMVYYVVEEVHYNKYADFKADVDQDFALLVLNEAVPGVEVPDLVRPRDNIEVPPMTEATVYGYGLATDNDHLPLPLRVGKMTTTSLEYCRTALQNALPSMSAGTGRTPVLSDRTICSRPTPSKPCSGDSGGPVVVNGKVVAVHVMGTGICSSDAPVIHVALAPKYEMIQKAIERTYSKTAEEKKNERLGGRNSIYERAQERARQAAEGK